MTHTAKAVLKAAETCNHQKLALADYGKRPYCASFVRWCFKQVNGTTLGLPLVARTLLRAQGHPRLAGRMVCRLHGG